MATVSTDAPALESRDAPRFLGHDAIVALLLVAALPALAVGGFTDATVVPSAIAALGGGLVLLLWAVEGARGRCASLRAGPLVLVLFALALVHALSAAWSATPARALLEGGRWLGVVAGAVVVLAPTRRRVSLRAIALTMTAGLVGGTVALYLRRETLGIDPDTGLNLLAGYAIVDYDLAVYSAIAVALAVAAAVRYDGVSRWGAIAGGALGALHLGHLAVPGVFFALGIGAALGLLPFFLTRRTSGFLVRTVGGLCIVAAIAFVTSRAQPFGPPPEEVSTDDAAGDLTIAQPFGESELAARALAAQWPRLPHQDGVREYLGASALSALGSSPIVGHGAGDLTPALDRYRARDSAWYAASWRPLPSYRSTGSAAIDALVATGALGGALLAVFLLGAALHAFRAALACPDEQEAETPLWGILTAGFVVLGALLFTPISHLPAAWMAAGPVLGGMLGAVATRAPGLGLASVRPFETPALRALVPLLILGSAGVLTLTATSQLRANWHRQFGNLHFSRFTSGDPDAARHHYGAASALDPEDLHAAHLLAHVEIRTLHFDAGVEVLSALRDRFPDNDLVVLSEGRALLDVGRHEEARRVYLDAIEQNPRLVEALLGRADAERGRNQGENAVLSLRMALALDPPEEIQAYVHARLAMVLTSLNRFDDAQRQADLARAIAVPRRLQLNLASIYETLDRRRNAKAEEDAGKPMPHSHSPLGDDGHGHGHDDGHGHGGASPPPGPKQPSRRGMPSQLDPSGGHDHPDAGHDHAGGEGHDHPGGEGHDHPGGEGHDHPGGEGHDHPDGDHPDGEGHDHADDAHNHPDGTDDHVHGSDPAPAPESP